MLPGAHFEAHVMQHHTIATRHIDMPQFKEFRCLFFDCFRPSLF